MRSSFAEEMISLDDSAWTELQHAYGSASDIPDLLREIQRRPGKQCKYNEDPWGTLWSSLCHQGTIYSASIAAVPHIVSVGLKASTAPIAWDFLALPSSIEQSRLEEPSQISKELITDDYHHAIQQLFDLVVACRGHHWSHEFAQSAASAIVIAKGHLRLGDVISEMGPQTMDDFLKYQYGE